MIGHHIDNQFESVGMASVGQTQVVLVLSQARINFVVIAATVVVVGIICIVVVEKRCRPERSHAQIGHIRHFRNYPFYISSVALAGVEPVHTLKVTFHGIVGRIAIGEAVGHQQVHSIGFGKAFPCCRT